MKRLLSIYLLVCSISLTTAQNNADAEALINDLIKTINTKGIQSDFSLKVSDDNLVNLQEFTGRMVMHTNKFFLETDILDLWYNGTTQWVLMKAMNEVTITSPSEDELSETNPMWLILNNKSKYNIRFSQQKNQQNHMIELVPQSQHAGFSKLNVQINKANKTLQSVQIQEGNGTTTKIVFKNFQVYASQDAGMFYFDASEVKGVIINDMR